MRSRYIYPCLAVLISILVLPVAVHAAPPAPAKKIDLDKALDVNELKIAMAESSLRVNHSLRTIADLSAALERHLNAHCMGTLLQTLQYDGAPTDPDCIARMDRLLEIYPDNPVAICVRDGIGAQSCVDAYRNQNTVAFAGGSTYDEIPDPALKVGLSAEDSKKLTALRQTLFEVNQRYQAATTDADKQIAMDDATNLYDQVLSLTCKVVALRLDQPEGQNEEREDSSITEVREKLLKIPPGLREDYQKQLLQKTEEELSKAGKDVATRKLLLQKMVVIQNPEDKRQITAAGKLRVRVVLPQCLEHIQQAQAILPNFPSPTCHREGWYSPQCIVALKKWYAYRQRLEAEARKREPKLPTPTPHPIISTF
jgi:hypothetical protein